MGFQLFMWKQFQTCRRTCGREDSPETLTLFTQSDPLLTSGYTCVIISFLSLNYKSSTVREMRQI